MRLACVIILLQNTNRGYGVVHAQRAQGYACLNKTNVLQKYHLPCQNIAVHASHQGFTLDQASRDAKSIIRN